MKPTGYVSSYRVRVRYADVDQMGFVYYSNYLRWFEIGRTEFLRELCMTYREVEESGVFYPVTEAKVKYAAPAHYDELIEIRTRLGYIKKASLRLEYEIVDAESGKLHAEGYTVHAAVAAGGGIVRISDDLINILTE